MIKVMEELTNGVDGMLTFNCPHCNRAIVAYGYVPADCRFCKHFVPPVDLFRTKKQERMHYYYYGVPKHRIF